jgi:LPS export ABC transporter protein LptC
MKYSTWIPASILFAGILFSCREMSHNELTAYKEIDRFPDEIMTNLHMISTDSGSVNFELKGVIIETFYGKINKTYIKDGLQLTFYDAKTKEVQAILTSFYGERDLTTENMLVRDSVVVQNKERNHVLKTEELIWKNDSIFTMKKVEITTPDDILTGFGLVADQQLNYFKIKFPTGRRRVK